jgi:5-methyltetrahydrofolate--homocysteine methyltransferase
LLGNKKDVFVSDLKTEYAKVRENHTKNRAQKTILKLEEARANALQVNWSEQKIVKPNQLGVQQINVSTNELIPYIDWTPFFRTWELHGKYPQILDDEVVGQEAKGVFDDAQKMLNLISSEEWLTHKGVVGIFPAAAIGDDIEIYANETRKEVLYVQKTMRQQSKKASGVPNIALADFIAPKGSDVEDYIGGFAVTSGLGIEEYVNAFESNHDDYNSILLKALADRLAEAFAEYLHEKVRKELWGYASDEVLSNQELIKETYKGIRPAPGYPACPDHTEKIGLFEILNVTELTGINLTDSLAMMPTASVSGWYFANDVAKYFGVGKIAKDQVKSLAERKGMEYDEMEKWLSSSMI